MVRARHKRVSPPGVECRRLESRVGADVLVTVGTAMLDVLQVIDTERYEAAAHPAASNI